MDYSTPAFPVLHHLPEFAQTHVYWVGDAIQPSYPLSPPLLLPSIFPSIRDFSNELTLCVRWPKYWSFSFSISPSNEYSWLISFSIDWFDLLAVQRTPGDRAYAKCFMNFLYNSHTVNDQGSQPSPINRNWLDTRQEIQALLGLGWFVRPLGGAVCRGHVQYSDFAQTLKCGSWVLWWFFFLLLFLVSLYLRSRICLNCTSMQLFFSLLQFVFCCFRGVSRCKHHRLQQRVPGPSLSQHQFSKMVSLCSFSDDQIKD